MKKLTWFFFILLIVSPEQSLLAWYYPYNNQASDHYSPRAIRQYSQPVTLSQTRQSRLMKPVIRYLPPINTVIVQGNINLEIMGAPYTKLSTPHPYQGLDIRIQNHALLINLCNKTSTSTSLHGPIHANLKLALPELNVLTVSGNSRIIGHNLNSRCGLTINHCGCGLVCLDGTLHLTHLTNIGSATIRVNNTCSDHLHILATRHAEIFLTGTANELLIRAFEGASVDTRCVMARRALIQATDEALVTVRADDLRAFAAGKSNIYYYQQPCNLIQHNVCSGNVFQMER